MHATSPPPNAAALQAVTLTTSRGVAMLFSSPGMCSLWAHSLMDALTFKDVFQHVGIIVREPISEVRIVLHPDQAIPLSKCRSHVPCAGGRIPTCAQMLPTACDRFAPPKSALACSKVWPCPVHCACLSPLAILRSAYREAHVPRKIQVRVVEAVLRQWPWLSHQVIHLLHEALL